MVVQIRECMFNHFIPYLKPAFTSINKQISKAKNLYDFWDQNEFLEEIEENNCPSIEYITFAKRLCQSRSFIHFMDGYIDDTLVNFDLCNSIMCRYGLLKERYKLKKPKLTQNTTFYVDEVVKFNFKIPSYLERQVLFEKVQYILD